MKDWALSRYKKLLLSAQPYTEYHQSGMAPSVIRKRLNLVSGIRMAFIQPKRAPFYRLSSGIKPLPLRFYAPPTSAAPSSTCGLLLYTTADRKAHAQASLIVCSCEWMQAITRAALSPRIGSCALCVFCSPKPLV